MANLLILLALHFSPVAPTTGYTQLGDGTRVTRYGAAAPKSVKARNSWNRLNFSPAGVEPKIIRKGGVL